MTTACTEDARAIDPFPIRVDLSRGAMTLAMNVGDGRVPAILDTATPLTVVDPLEEGEPVPAPRRRNLTVTLVGLDDAGEATIDRARFPETAALELHPCPDDGFCSVGLDDDTVEFRGIVGADILARSSVRFEFPSAELRFFPGTSGESVQLGEECHAVFGRAFAGGGTLRVAGSEIVFGGYRPVVGACLDEEDAPDDEERGADALMLVSTGMGISVLAASAYDRYAAATGAPSREQLPEGELRFPSGPASVRLGRIGTAALVGSRGTASQDDREDRGPCRELYLNRVMSVDGCSDPDAGVGSCPCPNQAEFCSAAAAVDLSRSLDVAVLDDGHPLLQALRDELRPQTAELDGILGTRALASLRLELDYLNDRMVMRCLVGGDCKTLPAVPTQRTLPALEACRAQEELLPDGGVAADAATGGG